MDLVYKQSNNESLFIFRFCLYIWLIDSENLSFTLILKEKMARVDI